MKTTLINKNVMLPARTSIRLEPVYWDALHEIAGSGTIHDVVQRVNGFRTHGTLTSAVRVFVLEWYREKGQRKGILTPKKGQASDQRAN